MSRGDNTAPTNVGYVHRSTVSTTDNSVEIGDQSKAGIIRLGSGTGAVDIALEFQPAVHIFDHCTCLITS